VCLCGVYFRVLGAFFVEVVQLTFISSQDRPVARDSTIISAKPPTFGLDRKEECVG
jgi:hypothetical protein